MRWRSETVRWYAKVLVSVCGVLALAAGARLASREALEAQRSSPHYAHWRALAPAFAHFERDRLPPHVEVAAAGYRVSGARR